MSTHSNQDLFGDSSSSESDVADPVKRAEEVEAPKGATEAKQTEISEAPSAATAQNPADDDDDDEDAEFDDTADVVGLPSTTTAGTVVATDKAEERAVTAPEQEVKYSLPSCTKMDDPSKQRLFITKLPNLVGIQPHAFEIDDYLPDLEHETFGQASHNLMRWRYARNDDGHLIRNADEQLIRQSNSRLVEWEDGTWSLQIGKEVFAVDELPRKGDFPGIYGYLYLSQKATNEADQSTGTVLECVHRMAGRLTARPSSLQSEAHKALTVSIRQKTLKQSRIQEFATVADPELVKAERIRLKQDLEKAEARKQQQAGRRTYPGMSRQYLEEEEERDYDDFNVRVMKRRAKEEDDYGDDESFGSDSSSDDEDIFQRRLPKKSRTTAKEDDDDDVVMGESEDEEDDDVVQPAAAAKKPAHRAVLDDDDDSD